MTKTYDIIGWPKGRKPRRFSLLDQAANDALEKFCDENDIPEKHAECLGRLTGRGYVPPTTVEGWGEIYETIKPYIEP